MRNLLVKIAVESDMIFVSALPNWSNNTLKSGFSGFPEKTGSRIRNFFGLKPSPDQDGANKKRFSQIGPAVPE